MLFAVSSGDTSSAGERIAESTATGSVAEIRPIFDQRTAAADPAHCPAAAR